MRRHSTLRCVLSSLLIASDQNGMAAIDDELAELLGDTDSLPAPLLVSLQLANGETGVIAWPRVRTHWPAACQSAPWPSPARPKASPPRP